MNSNPLVSIIMPAYNTQEYIKEAIESVINQTYTNWELLIVDDLSTDVTVEIVNKMLHNDGRIKLINRQKNSGRPSIAKNSALPYTKGKYIAFLDSDDAWLEKKLEIQIAFMQKNQNYVLTYTGGYLIDHKGVIFNSFLPKYSNGKNLKNMLTRYEINNQSVVIKSDELFTTVENFNEEIIIGEDYNMFMHILAKYEIGSINQHLIKYRIHNKGITKSSKRVSDGVLMTLKELNNLHSIKRKYVIGYMLSYMKAIRFKYLNKNWK